jgi:hypothetical protein
MCNQRDRYDSEASEMQKTTDPQVVLNALKETLNAPTTTKEDQDAIIDAPPFLPINPTASQTEGID